MRSLDAGVSADVDRSDAPPHFFHDLEAERAPRVARAADESTLCRRISLMPRSSHHGSAARKQRAKHAASPLARQTYTDET